MATQQRTGTVKVTVNLPEDAVRALEHMKTYTGTVTQALKEAIALKLYLDEHVQKGGKVLVEHQDGSVERIVLLTTRAGAVAPQQAHAAVVSS